MNILCECIGVDGQGNWKWYCNACHGIILTSSNKNISCPYCEFKMRMQQSFWERSWNWLKYIAVAKLHLKIRIPN